MAFSTYKMSDYIITRDGEIINKRRNRHVKPQPNSKGYLRVHICGKMQFVHRLVAEMYVPNPDNKPQVNHIDGDKTNNCADNLEWVTNQENRDHAIKNGLHFSADKCSWSKLDWDKVNYIREHKDEHTAQWFADLFNVSKTAIDKVINNKSWKIENVC